MRYRVPDAMNVRDASFTVPIFAHKLVAQTQLSPGGD